MNLQYLKKKNILDGVMPPQAFQQGFGTTNAEPEDDTDDDDTPDTGDEQDASVLDDESQAPDPEQVTGPPMNGTGNAFTDSFKQATNLPKGPMTQRFSDFLQQPAPQKSDYKPSKMARLAGILGGASEGFQHGGAAGIKTASQLLDKPYEEGMQQYQLKGKNLEKGAEVESKDLGRASSFAKTAMLAENAKRTADLHAQDAKDRMVHWDMQDKAAAKKAESQGFQKTIGSDGHLYYTKPAEDGSVTTLDGGKVGESIPEKTKRELDLYKTKETVRGTTQKDINKASSDNVASREAGNLDKQNSLIEKRNAAGEERDAAKPANRALEIQNRIKSVIAANGDKVKDFFTPDGKAMTGPPSEGMISSKTGWGHGDFEDKLKQYHKVYSAIYGTDFQDK